MFQLVLACIGLIAICIAMVYVITQFWYLTLPGRAPYVASPIRIIAPEIITIIQSMIVRPNTVEWFELGSGRALLSRIITKTIKFKKITAIELNWFLVLLTKLENILLRSKLVVIRKNILDFHYPKGSVLYCYLFPELLEKLYKNQQFNNQLVLSLTFQIKGVTPTHTLPIKGFQKQIYIYDFRN